MACNINKLSIFLNTSSVFHGADFSVSAELKAIPFKMFLVKHF